MAFVPDTLQQINCHIDILEDRKLQARDLTDITFLLTRTKLENRHESETGI
jgi:hypothetical protein